MDMRLLNLAEKELILHMLDRASRAAHFRDMLADYLVEDMSDGGMGSVRFSSPNAEGRRLGELLYQMEFADEDGVPVIATLFLDSLGQLFELDMWKVDFSPLKRFPDVR